MRFRIPFTFSSIDKLKKRAVPFRKLVRHKQGANLEKHLNISDTGLTREDYLSICYRGIIFSFALLFLLSSTALVLFGVGWALLLAFGFSVLVSLFLFTVRMIYPKIYTQRRQKNIESNLISALQDMLVQLNSGIPLFSILVNISSSDYGALSEEFSKAVKKINAGYPQIEVLEEIGENNTSVFFRRALWQIGNGMRAGSDISVIIQDSVESLEQEQLIQIQAYGNKLNPAIMFYMLVSVIIPALAITFMTVISSLINLPAITTRIMFATLFLFVILVQVMFLGVIKSIRPSLM